MRRILCLLLLSLPLPTVGQCVARHGFSGQPVPAYEVAGITMGNAYAVANYAPNGWPVITYGPRFHALPPLLKEFVKLHECAHLAVPTPNEIQANCVALVEMRRRGLTPQDESLIANWTVSEQTIGFQYGGTGAAFWNMTLQCAGSR